MLQHTRCQFLNTIYNTPSFKSYLIIRKYNKDGEADEGEDAKVSKADGDDDAGVGDGEGEERADGNQLANEEEKRTNQPDEQKDLCMQEI